MRVEIEERSPVEKILKIEVEEAIVNEVLNNVINQIRKQAKIKGFRDGKAPLYLVKKLFREEIEEKGIERLIEKTLPEALREKNLDPLLRPRVESVEGLAEDQCFRYSVLVELRPEIRLNKEDYIGLEVEREKDEISEEEIDKMLEEIKYSFSPLERVDEAIQERYPVVVAFTAYEGNEPIPGHSAEALFIDVGTGEFNEVVEKALIGKKPGDKFTIEVEYPTEALNPLLAGKKVAYHIEIKEVYKRELQDLTDELVKTLNLGVDSLEKLRELIQNRLLQEKKRKNQNKFRERILNKILEKVNFEVPKRYVEIKFYQLLEELKDTLTKEGLNFEKLNLSFEALRERLYPKAEQIAREEILLEEIAKLEGIEIPREELEKNIENIRSGLNISREEAERIVYFNIAPKMLAERVLKFLEENTIPLYKE
ncbi:MAG: trigger factor [Thermodesulfobacteriaceae bacterium]|nr:trigger factor [Thermodesulfobacteriaceae bacterium]